MIYEWFMVICLYAYVASSLGKALPLWRLRRRAKISGTRAERDEATFVAYSATWSTLAIAFAAFAAIVITSPDNQFVDVVRVEGALAPEACARVAAACVEMNKCRVDGPEVERAVKC